MRHARFVSPRGVLLACLGLACLVLSVGCTHNHYYGYNPCSPGSTMVVPGSVQSGAVCEVPGSPTIVAGGGSSDAPVGGGSARPPRVVVSEPGRNPGSRFSWRASDPEGGMVTTKVEGAIDSPTITR
jgi:hypothetical protein